MTEVVNVAIATAKACHAMDIEVAATAPTVVATVKEQ